MKRRVALVAVLGLAWVQALWGQTPEARLGATLHDGGATFRVWAQDASAVAVDVDGHPPVPMRAQGGDVWEATVPGVTPGQTYVYRITRDGATLMENDPEASALTEPTNGRSIIGAPWGAPAPFSEPSFNRMVIYEMHVGSFTPEGTFAGAEGKLPYLQSLGINAVELLPVVENRQRPDNSPMDYDWGYDPVDFNAVKAAYGSPQALAHLVSECHHHGMAVILDVVYNHVTWGSALDGTWFGPVNTPWGPRPDFANPHVREGIIENAMRWQRYYGIDGLRWDSVVNIRRWPQGTPDSEGTSLLKAFNELCHAAEPEHLMIAEDLQHDPEVLSGLGFDTQWDDVYWWALKHALVDRQTDELADRIADGTAMNRVIYSENHDKVGHPTDGEVRFPSLVDPDAPGDLRATQASLLAAALVLTTPGIPMLFQGQETLEPRTFEFHHRIPVDWGRVQRWSGAVAMYRDLIHLRLGLDGLAGSQTRVYHRDPNVLAWLRSDTPGSEAVVVANLSAQPQTCSIGLPTRGRWAVRFDSALHRYDPRLDREADADAVALDRPQDGLPASTALSLEPYSLMVLSRP